MSSQGELGGLALLGRRYIAICNGPFSAIQAQGPMPGGDVWVCERVCTYMFLADGGKDGVLGGCEVRIELDVEEFCNAMMSTP